MSADDMLGTLVELSVAVAGFSGVVVALSPIRPHAWSATARALFSVLLTSTLLSAGLCVFAMVLRSAPVAESTAWSVASAAQIAVLAGVISLRLAQFSRSPERGRALPSTFRALLGLNAVILATQAANIAHYRAGWLCVAGLSLYAFFGFFVFVMLVAELWGGAAEAG